MTSENPTPATRDEFKIDPVDDDEVGEITLLWEPPGSTGGSAITGYELQVLDVSTRTWVAEATLADDVEPTPTKTSSLARLYYYNLRAVNDISVGPWTPFVTATCRSRPSGRSGTDGNRHRQKPSISPGPFRTTWVRLSLATRLCAGTPRPDS